MTNNIQIKKILYMQSVVNDIEKKVYCHNEIDFITQIGKNVSYFNAKNFFKF